MTAQTSRLILIIAAFVAGLVLCLSVVLLIAQRGSMPLPQASAVGGPFELIDQDGRTVTEQDMMENPSSSSSASPIAPTSAPPRSSIFPKSCASSGRMRIASRRCSSR